jgi:hypothetical protein
MIIGLGFLGNIGILECIGVCTVQINICPRRECR